MSYSYFTLDRASSIYRFKHATLKKIDLLLVFLLCLYMSTIKSAIILCDLGDTLVSVNQLTYARDELGIAALILNGLTNSLKFNPQKRIFETLEKIGGTQEVLMHESDKLPKIYCDWMAGMYQDSQKLQKELLEQVDILYYEDFFVSYSEYCVIHNAIKAMFSPEVLIKHLYIIEPMFDILKKIDTSKHTIVAATNWDPHSFKLFLESEVGKRISQYIKPEHMIVSGYIKKNKPDKAFYEHIINLYGQEKKDYIFIDNDQKNINSAQDCDIDALKYTGDADMIEQALIFRAII